MAKPKSETTYFSLMNLDVSGLFGLIMPELTDEDLKKEESYTLDAEDTKFRQFDDRHFHPTDMVSMTGIHRYL